MKNGFTLIELLAVIVILAVIALIATPIVLSIINDTKVSALLRSAEFYVSAVENSIMRENMNSGGNFNPKECVISSTGVICDTTKTLEVEINGEAPSSGNITFQDGKITGASLTFGDRTITLDSNGKYVYQDGIVEPKLAPGLYDANDNLKISWDDLTSMDYQTVDCDDWGTPFTSSILSVDENGELTTPFHGISVESCSAEYLVGKLVIDESVTSIGIHAFSGCDGLKNVIIPESVTSIGQFAFNSSGLTSITIPAGVTSIEWGAFSNSQLTSVTIPDSVTSIGESAFYENQLTSVTIPNSVTSIGYWSFGSNQLTSVTIPKSVTSIHDYAFSANPNLVSIEVDKNNPVYDSRNNSNAIIETATNTLVSGCKTTVIPNSVTSIGSSAFYMNDLTSVTIPDSVTSIGQDAFRSNKLTSVTIPNSVTRIGDNAFSDNQLTSVIIKGKSSISDFYSFDEDAFGWASGYSDSNITWQP